MPRGPLSERYYSDVEYRCQVDAKAAAMARRAVMQTEAEHAILRAKFIEQSGERPRTFHCATDEPDPTSRGGEEHG